jgi:UDP-N-acetylglucosamine acyltransferase
VPAPQVHPTAIVSDQCVLGEGVRIGPYCVLEGRVELGEGVRLVSHVCLTGPLTVGPGTAVWPFAAIGMEPQDVKFSPGGRTAGVSIGARCLIREHVTIHAATGVDRPTSIGDRCFLMAASHVGHDVVVGRGVTMMNYAALAGHASVGDGAVLSGHTSVHQFTRVGRLAMISGLAGVSMDTPPFCVVNERNRLGGVNLVGMRRAGIPREQVTQVRRAFREALRPAMRRDEMLEILDAIAAEGDGCPPVAEMAGFIRGSSRAICPGFGKPPRGLATLLHYRRRGKLVPGVFSDEEED